MYIIIIILYARIACNMRRNNRLHAQGHSFRYGQRSTTPAKRLQNCTRRRCRAAISVIISRYPPAPTLSLRVHHPRAISYYCAYIRRVHNIIVRTELWPRDERSLVMNAPCCRDFKLTVPITAVTSRALQFASFLCVKNRSCTGW